MRILPILSVVLCSLFMASPAHADYYSDKYTDPTVMHWANRTIYVENHASASYSVGQAALNWDYNTRLTMINATCRAGYPCIRVYSGAYGKTGWAGISYISYSGDVIQSVKIQLNDTYPGTATDKKHRACHELGHGVGIMGHRYEPTSSCMGGPSLGSPDAIDRVVINREYLYVIGNKVAGKMTTVRVTDAG